MYHKIDLEQGSDEWLEFRRSHIGASDAPIIMGVSPWSNVRNLYYEKLGLQNVPINHAMKRGTELEDLARKYAMKHTGFTLSPAVIKSDKYDWMSASLDACTDDMSYVLEIKCPGQKTHEMASYGKIPDYYYPQLQHQMACCGIDLMYYMSFDGENGIFIQVKRDDEYIEKMIIEEKKFYNSLINFEEPKGKSVLIESNEWKELAHKYLENKELEKKINEENEKIKQRLIELCNGQSAHGCGISIISSERKGNIQYKSIPELQFVDLEKYRDKSTTVFRVVTQ